MGEAQLQAVKEYIAKHNLEDELSNAVNQAIKLDSDDPYRVISDYLRKFAKVRSGYLLRKRHSICHALAVVGSEKAKKELRTSPGSFQVFQAEAENSGGAAAARQQPAAARLQTWGLPSSTRISIQRRSPRTRCILPLAPFPFCLALVHTPPLFLLLLTDCSALRRHRSRALAGPGRGGG